MSEQRRIKGHDVAHADSGASEACRYWIGVASANHVRLGRREGFMQLGHGKLAPLRRIRPGDRVVYYSPTETFGVADAFRQFVAIGVVLPGEPTSAIWRGASSLTGAMCSGQTPMKPRSHPYLESLSSVRGKRIGVTSFDLGCLKSAGTTGRRF